MTPLPHPIAPPPVRVVVVDADRRVRQSLGGLLEVADEIDVVGVASDAPAALDLVASSDPDVVLIDPRLPELDAGLALLARLRLERPELVVIAMSCSDALEHPALSQGADAFVAKGGQTDELIELVVQLGRRIPFVIADSTAADPSWPL